jgi:uncharacterized protein (TIGR02588 family)
MPEKNPLEWGVFAVSLLLIAGVVGLLVYDAARGAGDEPAVAVRPGLARVAGELLEIPVLIENTGDEAAADLLVEVTVRQAGGAEERAELTVPLLAPDSSAQGLVVVRRSGAVEAVVGRVVAYRLP